MRKTKIVCTMGPNTNDREMMKQLALSGMDVPYAYTTPLISRIFLRGEGVVA